MDIAYKTGGGKKPQPYDTSNGEYTDSYLTAFAKYLNYFDVQALSNLRKYGYTDDIVHFPNKNVHTKEYIINFIDYFKNDIILEDIVERDSISYLGIGNYGLYFSALSNGNKKFYKLNADLTAKEILVDFSLSVSEINEELLVVYPDSDLIKSPISLIKCDTYFIDTSNGSIEKKYYWSGNGYSYVSRWFQPNTSDAKTFNWMVERSNGKTKEYWNGKRWLAESEVESLHKYTCGQTIESSLEYHKLVNDLNNSENKHCSKNILSIGKKDKIYWLEKGNTLSSGLTHILNQHQEHFSSVGIAENILPYFLIDTVINGKIIGIQGRSRKIYEITYNGETYSVAIEIGSNGYIVGANPRGKEIKNGNN